MEPVDANFIAGARRTRVNLRSLLPGQRLKMKNTPW
jgi:hypothetical protein